VLFSWRRDDKYKQLAEATLRISADAVRSWSSLQGEIRLARETPIG